MLYHLILVLVLYQGLTYQGLLSICTYELISTPKMITFLPTLPSGKEYSPRESNLMP